MVNDDQPNAHQPPRKKNKGTCKEVESGDIVCGLAVYAKGYCPKHYGKRYRQEPKGACKEVGYGGIICGMPVITKGYCTKHYEKRYCTHMITLEPPFGDGKQKIRCTQRAIKNGVCRDHGAPRVPCNRAGCKNVGYLIFNSMKLCKSHYDAANAERELILAATGGLMSLRQERIISITVPAGKLGLHVKLREDGRGVEITNIESDSRIKDMVMVGDIIMKIDQTDVVSMECIRTGNDGERHFLISRQMKNDENEKERTIIKEKLVMANMGKKEALSKETETKEMEHQPMKSADDEIRESTINERDEHVNAKENDGPENEGKYIANKTRKKIDNMKQEIKSYYKDKVAKGNIGREQLERLEKKKITDRNIEEYIMYLRERDEDMCRRNTREKASIFKSLGFIAFDKNARPKMYEEKRSKKDECIFDMKYVFIPIDVGGHFTCVVVYMEERRICYYDSYKSTKTRSGVNAGIEKRKGILKTVQKYLEAKHLKEKGFALPDQWTLEPTCSEIQQENTKDCGVFVCMYMDFIHDGCEVNFDLKEFTSEEMRSWMAMVSSVQNHEKRSLTTRSDDDECIQIDSGKGKEMKFSARAKQVIMKSNWKERFEIGVECELNKSLWIECDENCNGGDECKNKNVVKSEYKKVRVGSTNGKGEGLFAMEDIKKGEYIIEYVGEIKYKETQSIYGLKYHEIELWIDATKKGNTSRFFNHSCNPNCVLEQWSVNGMPHMCFFANKDINSGTELTFDYNWTLDAKDEEDFKSKATECKCGTRKEKHYIEKMVSAGK